uniref:Metalloprotease TIKI1 n=1 Tax=Danio rerio TaxID=7955 RepID=TIKI1_DANRE|nr:RecName: Full=Metalloprotease TIKI1; AltName: Full=TRAB domain-containing protein 2A; Flags: Precursor [Danio rerio]
MTMMTMMMVSWSAFLQICWILMVRANQFNPGEPSGCRTNTPQSDLNSFLWTIKRDPPSYLYGTIHVPYTRVWDFIPQNSKQAFQESSVVYFELELTDPSTISALSRCQLLPAGQNLQDVLPPELYLRLKTHLEYVRLMLPSWMTPDQRGKGLYAEYLFNAIAGNWERKRPVWVMLMVNSLTEADIKTRGVPVLDLYLAQEAERMKKQTGAVEKVEEQCSPLNTLDFSQVIFALNQTLLQQESVRAGSLQVPYTTEHLITHYNCGDLHSIISHDTAQVPNFNNVTLRPSDQVTAQQIDSYFRRELIYKRNERMGRRVTALLQEQPHKTFFFAFGAGHFLGNNSVIDVLRREGYEVEHTPAGQPLHRRSGWRSADPADTDAALQPFLHHSRHHELQLLEGLELLEKVEHKLKKKHRRNKLKKQRQFNDLWVRMEDSVTAEAPPPLIHIINGYITVQTHPQEHERANHDRTFSGSSSRTGPALSALAVCVQMLRLLL